MAESFKNRFFKKSSNVYGIYMDNSFYDLSRRLSSYTPIGLQIRTAQKKFCESLRHRISTKSLTRFGEDKKQSIYYVILHFATLNLFVTMLTCVN